MKKKPETPEEAAYKAVLGLLEEVQPALNKGMGLADSIGDDSLLLKLSNIMDDVKLASKVTHERYFKACLKAVNNIYEKEEK